MANTASTKSKQTVPTANSPADVIPANKIETTENSVSPPSHDAIAQLAYSYWEARGCQGGSPEEDWFRAEQELLTKPQKKGSDDRRGWGLGIKIAE